MHSLSYSYYSMISRLTKQSKVSVIRSQKKKKVQEKIEHRNLRVKVPTVEDLAFGERRKCAAKAKRSKEQKISTFSLICNQILT